MSTLAKGTLSYRKVDSIDERPAVVGFKKLTAYHQATVAGVSDINITALNLPSSLSSLGYTNPSTNDLQSANILNFNQNVMVISSLHGLLMQGLSYDIPTNTIIRLKSGAQTQVGEIFTLIIDPVAKNAIQFADAYAVVSTGTLAAGFTDYVVGTPFTVNKYSTTQVGDVLVYRNGILQMRNIGNISTGQGNYYEIAPASGNLANTIRFNVAPSSVAENIVVVSNGLVTERPSAAILAVIQTIAGQIDNMIPDLAAALGNPTTNYQTAPNQVDLQQFGNLVKSFIAGGLYNCVVGSAAQFAAGIATHTSVQAAHDACPAGGRILVLDGTYTENVTWSKKIRIEGKGNGSSVVGSLSVQSGAALGSMFAIRWGGSITIAAGANSIFIRECWVGLGFTVTDNGTNNSVLVLEE